jgi:hypothetical protein
MNEGQFQISITESIAFLKRIELFKDKGTKPIGQHSDEIKKISKSNKHKEIYECVIRNFDYEIILSDDSIFQFSFSPNDIRYAYIQNPCYFVTKEEYIGFILSTDEPNELEDIKSYIEMIDENEYEQFLNEQQLNSLSNFFRYDASLKGYTPLIHPFSHLHIGLNSNIRIPLSIIITPLAFVKFCIKNSYYDNWKNAVTKFDNFTGEIQRSKNSCISLDRTKWSEIEEHELYIK